jgi:hypothetical protein
MKQRKRNAVSRHLHAKNDKERIAAWRSDLIKILHVFNVRSIPSVRLLLTRHSQTELAINTHVAVSELGQNVTSTHIMVSDIHRNMMKGQGGSDGINLTVSETCTPSTTE